MKSIKIHSAYQIEYNDFGSVIIIADTFEEAIKIFREQWDTDFVIKKITYQGDGL